MKSSGYLKGWFAPAAVAASAHVGLAFIPVTISKAQAMSPPPALQMSLLQPEPQVQPEPQAPEPAAPAEDLGEPPPQPRHQPPSPPPKTPVTAQNLAAESSVVVPDQPVAEPAEEIQTSEATETVAEPEPAVAPQPSQPIAEARPAQKSKSTTATTQPVSIDWSGYQQGLYRSLLAQRQYPPMARRMGLEGIARVRFVLNKSGKLAAQPALAQSSGHTLLDEQALEMASRAAFAPLPAGTPNDTVVFVVPVRFDLPK